MYNVQGNTQHIAPADSPRFIITTAGDTYELCAALTNGDYLVRNPKSRTSHKTFHISAKAIAFTRR